MASTTIRRIDAGHTKAAVGNVSQLLAAGWTGGNTFGRPYGIGTNPSGRPARSFFVKEFPEGITVEQAREEEADFLRLAAYKGRFGLYVYYKE